MDNRGFRTGRIAGMAGVMGQAPRLSQWSVAGICRTLLFRQPVIL